MTETAVLESVTVAGRPERARVARAFTVGVLVPGHPVDGSFWHFMRTHYEAHLVVAEVENLRGGPGKDEILQVANYLNPRGTGLFALILARADLNQTARRICDPAELVRQKIEDFRLGI